MFSRALFCCTATLLFLLSHSTWSATTLAQDRVVSDLYGSGVHQYFAGDYQQAITDLTAAINAGSQDPRVFYFRGLTYSRLGDDSSAQSDMRRGARLEAGDGGASYPVGRALERIQGPARQTLERYRAAGRTAARQTQISRDAQRYEQRRRAEAEVLRHSAPPIPPVEFPRPSDPGQPSRPARTPAPAPPAPVRDLFSDGADTPAAAQPKAMPPAMEDDDPLGVGDVRGSNGTAGDGATGNGATGDGAASEGQSDDLFGGGDEADATARPRRAPTPPAGAAPASPKRGAAAPAPAAQDPFAETPQKPADSKAADGDEDLFGN